MRTKRKETIDYTDTFKQKISLIKVFGMLGQKDSFAIQQFLKQVEILEKLINKICLPLGQADKPKGGVA